MGPSHTQGCAEVSEPPGLSAGGISTHTAYREREVCFLNVQTYPNATILLRDRIYMRLVSRSQLHSPE